MEKEFIPYEQALALKELGFDEPCLGNFADDENHTLFTNGNRPGKTNAPTYSQAFRWFREKYKLEPEIVSDMFGYVGSIVDRNKPIKIRLSPINLFQTYEEAELACLDKLIEIIKAK
jgi:hypothetical protein